MQRYEGTKRLSAKPMSRGEYNDYRGWETPDDENPHDAGYLVEYEDGGKANDSRHVGYISWSPADVFERTYKVIVLAPHQQRAVTEKAELDDKIAKLGTFATTASFVSLPVDERLRLVRQWRHMEAYSSVLGERIAAF